MTNSARGSYAASRAEKFLIVQYGDHQPVATRTMLGFDKSYSSEDMKLAPDSPGFITYYAIDGINYTPPPLPAVQHSTSPISAPSCCKPPGFPCRTPI